MRNLINHLITNNGHNNQKYVIMIKTHKLIFGQ